MPSYFGITILSTQRHVVSSPRFAPVLQYYDISILCVSQTQIAILLNVVLPDTTAPYFRVDICYTYIPYPNIMDKDTRMQIQTQHVDINYGERVFPSGHEAPMKNNERDDILLGAEIGIGFEPELELPVVHNVLNHISADPPVGVRVDGTLQKWACEYRLIYRIFCLRNHYNSRLEIEQSKQEHEFGYRTIKE